MNKPLVVATGVVLLILLSTVLGSLWYISSHTYDEPAKILELSNQILPLQMPADMRPIHGRDLVGVQLAIFGQFDEFDKPVDALRVTSYPLSDEDNTDSNWDFMIDGDWKQAQLTQTASGDFAIPYQGEQWNASFREGTKRSGEVYRALSLKREIDGKMIAIYWLGPDASASMARFTALFQNG